MSADTTVEVSKRRNGRYTAVDTETGDSAEGETRAEALAKLARRMATLTEATDELDELVDSITTLSEAMAVIDELAAPETTEILSPASEFASRSRDVQQRFDDEDVTDDDVAEAIEWARSE